MKKSQTIKLTSKFMNLAFIHCKVIGPTSSRVGKYRYCKIPPALSLVEGRYFYRRTFNLAHPSTGSGCSGPSFSKHDKSTERESSRLDGIKSRRASE